MTLLTTREALIAALDAGIREWENGGGELLPILDRHASGAVVDAATLATDEALVEAGAKGFYEGFDSNPHHRRQWPAPEQHIPWWHARSRDVLRALAAALSEPVETREAAL